MPNTNLEITQKAMEDFKKIQEYMLAAKEENAVKTYEKLKEGIDKAADAIEEFLKNGIEVAMNKFN